MSGMVCCTCGSQIRDNIVRMTLEHHEIISQAEAHGRFVTVDAAVACSILCLSRYLAIALEGER